MQKVKIEFKGLFKKSVEVRGYIRISTAGVLQIMDSPENEGRKSGNCLYTYSAGNWKSAVVTEEW